MISTLACTLALATSLAACGKAEPSGLPTPSATGRSPCSYLVRADAEAALGLPLPGTTETIVTGECIYHSPEFYGVNLTLAPWDVLKTHAMTAFRKPPLVVTGLGDEALSQAGRIFVRKGDRGFMVTMNGPKVDGTPDEGLARAEALAAKIAPTI